MRFPRVCQRAHHGGNTRIPPYFRSYLAFSFAPTATEERRTILRSARCCCTKIPGTSCSRYFSRSCGSGADSEQSVARGQRGTGHPLSFSTASPIAKNRRARGLLKFAVCSPSISVRPDASHSRFVFGLRPSLAATNATFGIGS
jgi:hypothetical protein